MGVVDTRELPVWAQVDLDRFGRNLAAIRAHTAGCRLLLVVKADAYGHGAVVMAGAALAAGVDMLGVATVHEGIQLRRAGLGGAILVLSPCLPAEVPELVRHGLRPTVPTRPFLEALGDTAQAAGLRVPVHLELETGMGRSGLDPQLATELALATVRHAHLQLEGVLTHFPDADRADPSFALRQLQAFQAFTADLERQGVGPVLRHAANSAAILKIATSSLDMVRPGLLAYGVAPDQCPPVVPVEPVLSYRSRLVQIRAVGVGETVSYGRKFTARAPMRIGVVAVGYGHGLPWRLSNRGEFLVRGRRAPIVGRVTMDLTMVDLALCPDAQVGDEVVIFGAGASDRMGVGEVAALCDTIPYEILCAIAKRVPRVYLRDGVAVKMTTLVGERRRAADRAVTEWMAAPPLPTTRAAVD